MAALTLATSTAASLLAAEAAARFLRPGLVLHYGLQHVPVIRHDPELGWSHIPGARGRFSTPEFSHMVSINDMGFRDRDRPGPSEVQDPDAFRVAVLGDSMVWGHGVEDEEVFTRIMERLLPGVEAWNFGVNGYSTDQELLLYGRIARLARFDLVLLVVSRTDFEQNVSDTAFGYPKPRYVEKDAPAGGGGVPDLGLTGIPVPPVPLSSRILFSLRTHSAFVEGLLTILKGRERVHEGREGQIRMMRRLLAEFHRQSSAQGSRFAVVIAPIIAHVYFETISDPETIRLQGINAWGDQVGVPVLDLIGPFREAHRATGQRFHYWRDRHWNAAGHRLVAEALARTLLLEGLIPPPGGSTGAP